MQGLIIGNIANLYKIKFNNKIYNATARGRFKKDETTPVVGDLVDIQIINEEKQEAVIEKINTRKSYHDTGAETTFSALAECTKFCYIFWYRKLETEWLYADSTRIVAAFQRKPVPCTGHRPAQRDRRRDGGLSGAVRRARPVGTTCLHVAGAGGAGGLYRSPICPGGRLICVIPTSTEQSFWSGPIGSWLTACWRVNH